MDVAEKLKHLEALREARKAKQKLVEQFAAHRAESTPQIQAVLPTKSSSQSAYSSSHVCAAAATSVDGNGASNTFRSSGDVVKDEVPVQCGLSLVSNQGPVSIEGVHNTADDNSVEASCEVRDGPLTLTEGSVEETITDSTWLEMLQCQGYRVFSESTTASATPQGPAFAALATPHCAFTPRVLNFTSRRLVLDVTSCVLPYHGFATSQPATHAAPREYFVPCVMAAYASEADIELDKVKEKDRRCPPSREVPGGAEGQLDHRLTRHTSPDLASSLTPSASAALHASGEASAVFRAEMNSSVTWGQPGSVTHFTPSSMFCRPHASSATLLESSSRVERDDLSVAVLDNLRAAPGLVLAMISVPIPASAPEPALRGCTARDAGNETNTSTVPERLFPAANRSHTLVIALPLLCDAEVCVLLAHPYQPHLLLGGTRSGQVVSWLLTPSIDVTTTGSSHAVSWDHMSPRTLLARAMSSTGGTQTLLLPPQRPVYMSFPSPTAHQGPILHLAMLGDAKAHLLYSVSEEGRVCTWPAWQALRPATVRAAYLGSHPLGHVGTSASVLCVPGTDAMTQVLLGDATGGLLSGRPRDAQLLEVRPYPAHRSDDPAQPTVPDSAGPGKCGGGDASHYATSPETTTRRGAVVCVAVQPRRTTQLTAPACSTASRPVTASAGCILTVTQDGECLLYCGGSIVAVQGTSQVRCAAWCPAVPFIFALGDDRGQVSVYDTRTSLRAPLTVLPLGAGIAVATSDAATTSTAAPAVSTTGPYTSAPPLGIADGFGCGSREEASTVLISLRRRCDSPSGALPTLGAASDANYGTAVTCMQFAEEGRWLCVGNASGSVYMIELSLEDL